MRRLLLVVPVTALLAACSSAGNAGSPANVAQSSVTPSDSASPSADASSASTSAPPSPSPAAVAARLAYATDTAVFVVSLDAAGKPTAPAEQVSDTLPPSPGGIGGLQWSATGRFLSWSQLATATEGVTYGLYDSFSGKHVTVAGPTNGSAGSTSVSSGLMVAVGSQVKVYDQTGALRGSRDMTFRGRTITLDTPESGQLLGSVVGSEPGGVLLTVGDGSSAHLVEVNAAGTGVDLGSLDPAASPLVNGGAGRGGYIAAEQGDHTDGCGVPPASVVLVVTPGTPATPIALPASAGSALERAIGVEVSPDHVVGATLVSCGNGRGAGYPTDFAELVGDHWHVVANDALAASRGPGGLLAYVHARIGGEGERYGPRGDQHLRIVTKTGTQAADLGGPVRAVLFAPAAG